MRMVVCFLSAATGGAIAVPVASAKLPDGRVYEMVSPPDTNGYMADPTTIAASGEAVGFEAYSAFAGAQELTGINFYTAVRTSAGWQTTPLAPASNDLMPSLLFSVWDDDFTSSVGGFRRPDQSKDRTDLYIRRPDGTFVDIGPTQSNPATPRLSSDVVWRGASGDLSHLVFMIGNGDHLLPNDTSATTSNNQESLYEYAHANTASPTLRLVGVGDDGMLLGPCGMWLGSDLQHDFRAISQTGATIFFTPVTRSGSCRPAGVPTIRKLYARIDLDGTHMKTVSISQPSPSECSNCVDPTAQTANFQTASLDGSKAFFTTAQELVDADTDSTTDLYEYDLTAPVGHHLTQVSSGDGTGGVAGSGANVLGVETVSGDGSHAYFVAQGVLTNAPNVFGANAADGDNNLYMFEKDAAHPDGRTTFIASLPQEDANADLWGLFANHKSYATPDGKHFVFSTYANIDSANDTDSGMDVYEYAPDTGALTLISRGTDGAGNSGDSASTAEDTLPSSAQNRHNVPVSDDGSYIEFATAEPLVPEDVNGASDVYEYHTGTVSLISDGQDPAGVVMGGMTPSGHDIFFQTRSSLVPFDIDNGVGTIYDARIPRDGEHPFPLPSSAAACLEDSCQGRLSTPPAVPSPPSGSFVGDGDAVPSRATATHGFSVARLTAVDRLGLENLNRLTVTVKLTGGGRISVKARGRIGQKERALGSSSRTVVTTATTVARVKLRLSAAARRELRHRHLLKVSISVSVGGIRGTKRASLTLQTPAHGGRS